MQQPFPLPRHAVRHRLLLTAGAMALLAGCNPDSALDWDLRGPGRGSTAAAAQRASATPPQPDSRGVLSYPGYQVAQARRGDTVGSVAARVGIDASELASANALQPGDTLRAGENLVLPRRVADLSGGSVPMATGVTPGAVDVTAIATTALDRAGPGTSAPAAAAPVGPQPARHRVVRGETAYTIARAYNVSARSLADWNGLGADMGVREGQTLLIPTGVAAAAPVETVPGAGSPTPTPPSATRPLPAEKTPTVAEATKTTPPGAPASPNLGAQRTAASAAKMAMPADGRVIRPYAKGRNEGIDIAAPAGSPVRAAADGTVAAITKDTANVPIVVLRHADNTLTVYAGLDNVTVAKGASVKRGQQFAIVRRADPAFLHFEVRKGVDSVDPMGYLQ